MVNELELRRTSAEALMVRLVNEERVLCAFSDE